MLGMGAVEELALAACRLSGLALAEAALELLHPATDVKDLLLAGVEGVALRAHVSVDASVRRGAARGERGPARADHGGLHVVRVDVGLHGFLSRRPPGPRFVRGEPEPSSQ